MKKGVHHISLKTGGEEMFRKTVAFYRDVLDCPMIRTWGEGEDCTVMLDLGNTILEITANGDADQGRGRFVHIALATDDVDALTEKVRAAGCPVFVEPKDVDPNGAYPIRIAFCNGPAGEEIEFFHEK